MVVEKISHIFVTASLNIDRYYRSMHAACSASNVDSPWSYIKKVKELIALNGTPSHSYGVSLAVWDHTVLPATRGYRIKGPR